MNRVHPIHGSDDAACRFLCLSAGQRTREDEEEIAKALEVMPYRGQALPLLAMPFNPAELWRLA